MMILMKFQHWWIFRVHKKFPSIFGPIAPIRNLHSRYLLNIIRLHRLRAARLLTKFQSACIHCNSVELPILIKAKWIFFFFLPKHRKCLDVPTHFCVKEFSKFCRIKHTQERPLLNERPAPSLCKLPCYDLEISITMIYRCNPPSYKVTDIYNI